MSDDPNDVSAALGGRDARMLGSGTFGDTWAVSEVVPGQDVSAVKIMKPENFHPRLLKREIEGLARFDHRGVVRLYEARAIVVGGQQKAALICEYVPGGSVADVLKTGGLPTRDQVVEFARSLFDAITVLHGLDTVHRDIKPDNILLRDGHWGCPVLIDFGLARSLTEKTYTVYPAKVGSLLWMSPEQLTGKKARKASDMWACGVVLYELLTGRHPFVDLDHLSQLDVDELLDRVSAGGARMPSDVPPNLSDVVSRLLIPDPQNARGSARRALNDLGG